MKTKRWMINTGLLVAAASISAVIAQSTYSGIYSGKQISDGDKVWLALTKGGRGIGLGEASRGLADTLNPAKTTVTSTGKFKGMTLNGETMISGTISSDYKFSGTVSWDGGSSRMTATRIYK